jgi:hypothetical protein
MRIHFGGSVPVTSLLSRAYLRESYVRLRNFGCLTLDGKTRNMVISTSFRHKSLKRLQNMISSQHNHVLLTNLKNLVNMSPVRTQDLSVSTYCVLSRTF